MAKARQFVVSVADRPGTVAEAIATLADARVNILSVLAWNPAGTLQMVTDNPGKTRAAFRGAKVAFSESPVELAELPNKPGALLVYLRKLAKKKVNLRSLCATGSKTTKKAVVVWTAES